MASLKPALWILSTGLAACSTSPVESPPTGSTGADSATVAEIVAAENRWLSAIQAADFSALDGLLAPEFVLASGRPAVTLPIDRSVWLSNSREKPEALRAMKGRLLRVAVAGRDVAVAEVELRWLGKLYFGSDTWVRRNGQWLVVYRHTSPARDSSQVGAGNE